jgi:predicted transposase/invertase (TIGR01784 family)
LPEDIVKRANWRTLKIIKETFISSELQERFSDILYSVRVKGTTVFIYLLFEHQSTPDDLMSFRFFQYMGGAWGLFLKQNPKETRIPGIVPILFYHGKDPWNVGTQFQDLIVEPELTAKYSPRFEYLLKDFSKFSDAEIKGNITVRLFLSVMRRIFSPDFSDYFDKMLPLFAELSQKQTGMKYLETVLRYIYDVRDDIDPKETETKLIRAIDADKKEGIVTVAEKLRAVQLPKH